MNRRNFFKKTAIAGASVAAISIPDIVNAAIPGNAEAQVSDWHYLSKGETILFQGDSITDAGRDRNKESLVNSQNQLGYGYAMFAAANILANHPKKNLNIFNRGISGNKVFQLADRWEKDCIELKPDYVSILIGVNDFWHTKGGGYSGTIEIYENDYRKLIERTKKDLPGTKIIICEPFIIHGGTALDNTWENDFAPYRNAARKIAKEFDLTFVPFQAVFNEALSKAPAGYWGADGVHPSMPGAQLMANAWLKATFQ